MPEVWWDFRVPVPRQQWLCCYLRIYLYSIWYLHSRPPYVTSGRWQSLDGWLSFVLIIIEQRMLYSYHDCAIAFGNWSPEDISMSHIYLVNSPLNPFLFLYLRPLLYSPFLIISGWCVIPHFSIAYDYWDFAGTAKWLNGHRINEENAPIGFCYYIMPDRPVYTLVAHPIP
jgi:hypothetical protein